MLLCAALAAGEGFAQNTAAPQQQLQDVQKQLRESRDRQRELSQAAAKLAQQQRELQKKLVAAARKLQAQEDLVSRSEEKLAELLADEQDAQASLEARRTELGQTLANLAHLSRQPPEAMMLAPGSALDMVRASQLMAALVPEIEQRAARLKDELTRLARLRAGVASEQEKLGAAIAQLDRERRELEFLQAETTAAAAQTKEDRENERERATQLAAQAKDLRALIDRLLEQERRDQERREQERRAAEARNRAVPPKTPTDGHRREPPEAYAALEGSAALPARGRLIGRYGQADENGVPLRGIRIETRTGGQVVAPADGKVMFAGPFRGYGQLLIIAHGGGYHSLLAGFGRIDRRVGQWVLAGEPVGQMSGGLTNGPATTDEKPVLYLELRRKGEPVNPLPWLASGDRKVSG